MIVNLASAKGPTAADLKVLERLAEHRRTFDVRPADEEEAYVLARAHATLDDMEECLCEEGPRAPDLNRGWRVVDQLEARLAQLQAMPANAAATPRPRPPVPPEGNKQTQTTRRPPPATEGDSLMLTTAIETIRSVAHRAAEDPQPPVTADRPPAANRFAARLWRLLARVLDTQMPERRILGVIARAIRALSPLVTFDPPPADPPAQLPSPPVKTSARIDLLRQERAARAQRRRTGEVQASGRPDRPPAHGTAAADDGVWNDLLDLTSEAVETFALGGDAQGAGRCVELLDVLSETCAEERANAA